MPQEKLHRKIAKVAKPVGTVVGCVKSGETGCQQLLQPCWVLLVLLSKGKAGSLLWH